MNRALAFRSPAGPWWERLLGCSWRQAPVLSQASPPAARALLLWPFALLIPPHHAAEGLSANPNLCINHAMPPPKPDEDLLPTRASLLVRMKDYQDNASWQEFLTPTGS